MNLNTVIFHSASPDSVIPEKKEILRYMGHRGGASESIEALTNAVIPKVIESLSPKGCFVLESIVLKETTVFVGDMEICSASLSKNLSGCSHGVVFALTVGNGADRLISSYSATKPAFALAASACATAAAEEYADMFCNELKNHFRQKNLYLRPRFSPGYGDFSIDFQKKFIDLTEASKHLGIYLTKAMMMTPSKSITGIIGVADKNTDCPVGGCEICNNNKCIYRR